MEDLIPLTPAQESMLVTSLMSPRAGLFVEVVCCESRETLDRAAFKSAWSSVVNAHVSLRGRVRWHGRAQPSFLVLPDAAVELRFEDTGALSEADLEAIIGRERITDFDLAAGALVRARVLDIGPGRFVFLWSFHHMLLDGAGIEIVVRDLFHGYDALVRGQPCPTLCPPHPGMYVRWLAAHRREIRHRSDEYWADLFAGLPEPASIAGTTQVPGGHDAVACARIQLTTLQTARLHALAAQNGLRVAALLYGCFGLCLAASSGARDLVFAYVRNCRKRGMARSAELASVLMSTLPLRLRLETYPTLRALLGHVAQQIIDTQPYEHSTLQDLQRCSGFPPDRPLYRAVFVFNGPDYTLRLARNAGRWVECERRVREWGDPGPTPTLESFEHPELELSLSYESASLPRASAEAFLGNLAFALTRLDGNLHASPVLWIEEMRRQQGVVLDE